MGWENWIAQIEGHALKRSLAENGIKEMCNCKAKVASKLQTLLLHRFRPCLTNLLLMRFLCIAHVGNRLALLVEICEMQEDSENQMISRELEFSVLQKSRRVLYIVERKLADNEYGGHITNGVYLVI